jgi:methylenetetrahydrofolate reductase (NADPH)
MKSGSRLERVLEAGHFAFTGELGPPQGANIEHVRKKASYLKGITDAVNITDNQTAVVRMASWAAGLIAIQEGLEPNYQMVCRDRNRIAMQADLLGAAALGLKNCLCIAGDHQKFSAAGRLKAIPEPRTSMTWTPASSWASSTGTWASPS